PHSESAGEHSQHPADCGRLSARRAARPRRASGAMALTPAIDDRTEWLETDGFGGFASGTTSGIRTRRYHALLLAATTPPTGRVVLVNGFDAWVTTPNGKYALSSQFYGGDVTHPDGLRRIEEFTPDPWPRWSFRLEDGTSVIQEIVAC